jgi:hypothetical protein
MPQISSRAERFSGGASEPNLRPNARISLGWVGKTQRPGLLHLATERPLSVAMIPSRVKRSSSFSGRSWSSARHRVLRQEVQLALEQTA